MRLLVLDGEDRGLDQKRLRKDRALPLTALEPHRVTLHGLAAEATYDCYWLVDGLVDAGMRVHLAHAPALPQ